MKLLKIINSYKEIILKMLDHVTIYVKDLVKSKIFYQKSFVPFGYSVSFAEDGKFCAFDIDNGALFEIAQYQGSNILTPCHIAFRANSHEQVEKFYQAALTAGGNDNGSPGLRPQYTENYYAAFIIDPSGHNIEAVFQPETTITV